MTKGRAPMFSCNAEFSSESDTTKSRYENEKARKGVVRAWTPKAQTTKLLDFK